ncbi:MAG: hypothetical protein ACFFCZ_22680 [Promethearchaeota archaeon]
MNSKIDGLIVTTLTDLGPMPVINLSPLDEASAIRLSTIGMTIISQDKLNYRLYGPIPVPETEYEALGMSFSVKATETSDIRVKRSGRMSNLWIIYNSNNREEIFAYHDELEALLNNEFKQIRLESELSNEVFIKTVFNKIQLILSKKLFGVGLDIDKVMEAARKFDVKKIDIALDAHTIGIVVSIFDRKHGPRPIVVEPPILKDNFEKLLELSDLAFSSGRFTENFEEEVLSFFDFTIGAEVRTTSLTFSFALERPEARAGSENIALNILVYKPYTDLIMHFVKSFSGLVHDIHMLMDKKPNQKDLIEERLLLLRRVVSAIIMAYEDIYGSIEASQEEKV